MAWQTPYTSWSNGNLFTYEDMNRITGNINYLYPGANLPEVTQNSFLTVSLWHSVLNALQTLIYVSGLSADVPGDEMTADTMNDVEDLIQRLADRIELNLAQTVATVYTGDDVYVAESGGYTDVSENYVRGGL